MQARSRRYDVHGHTEWNRMLSDEQWAVYGRVLREAQERGVAFAIGGGFAIAAYTGQCRATKDLDLYIAERDRETMIDIVTGLDLGDYYEKLPYDRSWIYRSYTGDVIVDVIWSMANHRAAVDEGWLARGPRLTLRGMRVAVIPAEEMVWDKLHVLQRDRCDWPDVLNLLFSVGPDLDWEYLVERAAYDHPLLSAALWLFSYVSPQRARALPPWLWERLRVPPPPPGPEVDRHHVELLDRRPWFAIAAGECLPRR